MKLSKLRFLLVGAFLLLLAGCGAGSDTITPPPDAPLTVVSGVAAMGAALDGATIEIIDGSGNLVDVGDVLTGSDGSYQVSLPTGVNLPVIVRVTPPGGSPLINVVAPPADGSTDVIANINPITNLVSNSVLAVSDATDNTALAGALALVDPTTIEASGDAVVEKLLGNSIKYSSFSNDSGFVAKVAGSTTPPSPTDAILDTLARHATASGSTVDAQLKALNEQADPPRLLEEPDFQVGLVSELVKGGTASEDLESQLASIGAIADVVTGEADVFRTIIQKVPTLINSVKTNATALADDADLLDIAADAAVDLLAATLKEKKDRFAANNEGLVNALNSPSLTQTVTKVIQSSVIPTLSNFVGATSTASVKTNLTKIVGAITKQAAVVTSSFQYTETSTDVSALVSEFIAQKVTTVTSIDDLESAASGASSVVESVGDINEAKLSIETFAGENTDLVEGSLDDLIEAIPSGTWGTSKWGGFNWG